MMLSLSTSCVALAAFHGPALRPAVHHSHALCMSAAGNEFDALVSQASATSVRSAVRILSEFEPTEKQTAALLDAACNLSSDTPQVPATVENSALSGAPPKRRTAEGGGASEV